MDHFIRCTELQDISDSLQEAVGKMAAGDRVLLERDEAAALMGTINELWNEVTNKHNPAGNKPKLFMVDGGKLYISARAIALVTFDQAGNAVLVTVNGSTVMIEALAWQMMRDTFHSCFELEKVQSTGRLVSA